MEMKVTEVACSENGTVNIHKEDEWCDICRHHGFEGPFSAVRHKVVNANGEVVAEAPVDGSTGSKDIARYLNDMEFKVDELEAQAEEDERLRAALRERVQALEKYANVVQTPPSDRHCVWSTTVALDGGEIHGAIVEGTKAIESQGCDVIAGDVTPLNDAEASVTVVGR